MPLLAVDPKQYSAASMVFGAQIAEGVTAAYSELRRGLAGTDCMAGSDSIGSRWSAGYEPAATVVAESVAAVQRACLALASMLQRTGLNYSLADADSDMSRRTAVPDTADYTSVTPLYWQCGDIPTAPGGSGEHPTGWGLVSKYLHVAWPDGRPDRLRAAATAWTRLGSSLDVLTSWVDDAVASIAEQQAPEALDATIICRGMKTHLADVGAACTQMGTACSTYADVIDKVHSDCTNLLTDLVNDIDTSLISGMIFAGETEGGSEGLALEYAGSRALDVAIKIGEYLGRFASDVGEIVDFASSVTSDAGDVTQALQPILTNGTTTADTVIVAGGPFAATHNAEVLAAKRFSVAAQINWAGLEASERLGGHTIANHVGRTRDQLRDRNLARASTFPTLSAAEDATSANIADHADEIREDIQRGKRKIVIPSVQYLPNATVYDRASNTLVQATRVITVILRGSHGYFVLTSYPD